ncbi:thiamine pyrophosphokinase [Entomoplasma freundtii]|uniref:Thiamine diphosphokinase n=1 Tax=Entomoplasma freundtii TaxID=74700 RepID=A0A2K8NQZ8_9MOLU|nr:thiamine diphosphokinase [Entomoplasma freundtii]ATZ16262.1 thiamine pyrophosphokinase [Entomoplasma freundtii]TDY56837.1 thiamine pyrophosphokinase [Entomoplasma freundtii]
MTKKAIVITAKTKINYESFVKQGFFLIGVERGALDIIEKKLPLGLAIGDFDKVTSKELEEITNQAQKVVILDEQKDCFDGEAAVCYAKQMGYEKIYFVANATKRYDKNVSVFNLIWQYDLTFINDETIMFLVKKGQTEIPFDRYQGYTYVSFLSNRPSQITINNMVYNAKDLQLDPFETKCMSNAFVPYLNPKINTNHDLLCIMSK